MPEFITYSKFYTQQDSRLLTDLLDTHQIQYLVEHEVNQLDNIYIGESMDPMFVVKVTRNDFRKVSELLTGQADADFQHPGFTYYLHDYATNELADIIRDPNTWNAYDLRMAECILQQRIDYKQPIKPDISTAYKAEKLELQSLLLGYVLALLTIGGIVFGLSLTQAKRTLMNGQTVPMYDHQTVEHGKRMIVIGLLTTILAVIARLLWN